MGILGTLLAVIAGAVSEGQHWLAIAVSALDLTPPTFIAGAVLVILPARRLAITVDEWVRYREPMIPRVLSWIVMCSGCLGLSASQIYLGWLR